MADDGAKLVVSLEAKLRQFERQMQQAGAIADREARNIETRFSKLNPDVGGFVNGFLKGGLATIGSYLAVDKVKEYADAWTSAGNKLRAAGLSATEVSLAQEKLSKIAARARTDFGAVSDLYGKLTLASGNLGASQDEVAIATETVAKAMKLGGASAQETASAVLQLGQALSSGTLQGDELRSLLENAPQLARVIANEFGVTVGQLRQLGSQGQLSASRVFQAIVKAQGDVDAAFQKSGRTFGETVTELQNTLISYVGTILDAIKQSAAHVEAMERERAKAEELRKELGLARPQPAAGPSATETRLTKDIDQAKQSAQDLETTLRGTIQSLQQFGSVGLYGEAKADVIAKLTEALNGDADAATKARVELEALGQTNPAVGGILNSLSSILEALGTVRREAIITKDALTSLTTPAAPQERPPAFFSGAAKAGDAQAVADAEAIASRYLNDKLVASKLDEKAKAVRAKADQLRSELVSKGLPVPGNLSSVAGRIVSNEGASKSSGSSSTSETDQYDRQIEQLQKRTEALRVETDAVGKSAFEADKAKQAFELLQAAKVADRDITPELTAQVEQLSNAYAKASEELRNAQSAQQQMNDLARFAGQSISGFFSDIISGGENAQKALMNLTKRLADAALQAALLGDGPLASLFGTKGQNGAVGGLLGAIFGGLFKRAGGGSVSSNTPYLVGENGPELMVPGRSGMVIPNDVVSRMGSAGSSGPVINVTQNFAPGVSARDLANILPQVRQSAIDGVRDLMLRGAL